jgi:hypothetical protein
MACGGCQAAAKRRAEAAARQQGKTAAQVAAEEQAKIPQANQQSTLGNTRTVPSTGKRTTQSFALQMRDGRTLKFGSRLEAEAENVRQGYTGTVKPI